MQLSSKETKTSKGAVLFSSKQNIFYKKARSLKKMTQLAFLKKSYDFVFFVGKIQCQNNQPEVKNCRWDIFDLFFNSVSKQFIFKRFAIREHQRPFHFLQMCLNVGGKKHWVMARNFVHFPGTRLGKLARAKTTKDINAHCDKFFPGDIPEYFFDHNWMGFNSILDVYRIGTLHLMSGKWNMYSLHLEIYIVKEKEIPLHIFSFPFHFSSQSRWGHVLFKTSL